MIPNSVVCVGGVAVFTQLFIYMVGGQTGRTQVGLLAMAAAFVVYTLAGVAGQMGMGDVKLLTFVLVPAWAVGPHVDSYDPLYAMAFLLVFHLGITVGALLAVAAAAAGERRSVIMGPGFLFAHIATVLVT